MADYPISNISSLKTYATATITTAADGLSNVIDLGGYTLRSVEMSTAWTAAYLNFRGSVSSSDELRDVYVTGVGVVSFATYPTTANQLLHFAPDITAGLRYLQLESGTSTGTAVAQAASRTIRLGLAPVDQIK